MRSTGIATVFLLALSQCAGVAYERPVPTEAEVEAAEADIRNAPAPAPSERSIDELVSMADRVAQRVRGGMKPVCDAIEAETCSFALRIAGDDLVAAFLDKGGTVWLTLGLLRYLNTEDEVAAIISHEVSHRLNADEFSVMGATKMHQQMRYELGGRSPASAASRFSGSARRMIEAEENADHLAGFLLHRAGYDLRKAEGLWVVLEKKGDRRAASIMATHPFVPERLAAWRRLSDELDTNPDAMPKRRAD